MFYLWRNVSMNDEEGRYQENRCVYIHACIESLISWIKKSRKRRVLTSIKKKENEVILRFKRRKLQNLGPQNTMVPSQLAKKNFGKRRLLRMSNFREWCKFTSIRRYRSLVSNVHILLMIANHRSKIALTEKSRWHWKNVYTTKEEEVHLSSELQL